VTEKVVENNALRGLRLLMKMMASGEDSPANRPRSQRRACPSCPPRPCPPQPCPPLTTSPVPGPCAARPVGSTRRAGRTGRLAWRRPSPSWRIRSCAGHSQPARRRARCAPCCRQGWGG
jgi:hypothetical protein